jgi:hypothetical protein
MKSLMSMNGYEVECPAAYGDEVLDAGWNPQLSLMSSCANDQVEKHHALLPTLANVDVDTFLNVMYRAQR